MEEMAILENSLKKLTSQIGIKYEEDGEENQKDAMKIMDLQQKIVRQRETIKYFKNRSLWNKSFDIVVMILVRSVFTSLSKLKSISVAKSACHVDTTVVSSSSMNLIHPSPINEERPKIGPNNDHRPKLGPISEERPKTMSKGPKDTERLKTTLSSAFLEESSRVLKPPENTLGGAGVALHYANLIVVMEKMIKQPHLVGLDARDDLYSMLPTSIRSSLKSRLKGVGFTASDGGLAAEWKEALNRILRWLLPLAVNMIKWQNERSFERQYMAVNSWNRVMVVETLVFADKVKTEAAITELLVGLNYIWRFEREITAKALFNLQSFSPNLM